MLPAKSDPEELTIVIRDAETDDSQAIAGLLKELGYPQDHDHTLKKIRKLSKRTKDRILVAQKYDHVVGCLSLHIMPLLHRAGNLCRVTALIVSEAYRGKYIGRRLMEIAEKYAKANGCSCIEITSGDQRVDAHRFYRQLGYVATSKRFIKSLTDNS
jgi:N-acetylglutamate synthase-like GNAT family acetyltransferase